MQPVYEHTLQQAQAVFISSWFRRNHSPAVCPHLQMSRPGPEVGSPAWNLRLHRCRRQRTTRHLTWVRQPDCTLVSLDTPWICVLILNEHDVHLSLVGWWYDITQMFRAPGKFNGRWWTTIQMPLSVFCSVEKELDVFLLKQTVNSVHFLITCLRSTTKNCRVIKRMQVKHKHEGNVMLIWHFLLSGS